MKQAVRIVMRGQIRTWANAYAITSLRHIFDHENPRTDSLSMRLHKPS